MILEKIIEEKKKVVEKKKEKYPLSKLIENKSGKGLSLKKKLLEKEYGIIAEIKRASPSAGIIRENVDIKKIAEIYESMGVCGISVLTCEPFFKGNLKDLKEVKEVVNIPVLMKDFIIDEYQIFEGKKYGADVILLIVRILDDKKLLEFLKITEKMNLEVIVEVHSKEDIERVMSIIDNWDNKILGINNRDLETLKVNLDTTINLIKLTDKDKIVVISESGIKGREDIIKLKEEGVRGFLIGESILKSGSIEKKLKEFI